MVVRGAGAETPQSITKGKVEDRGATMTNLRVVMYALF